MRHLHQLSFQLLVQFVDPLGDTGLADGQVKLKRFIERSSMLEGVESSWGHVYGHG